jgi:hypothetical protein
MTSCKTKKYLDLQNRFEVNCLIKIHKMNRHEIPTQQLHTSCSSFPKLIHNQELIISSNLNYHYADTLGHTLNADFDFGKYNRKRDNFQP